MLGIISVFSEVPQYIFIKKRGSLFSGNAKVLTQQNNYHDQIENKNQLNYLILMTVAFNPELRIAPKLLRLYFYLYILSAALSFFYSLSLTAQCDFYQTEIRNQLSYLPFLMALFDPDLSLPRTLDDTYT